MSKQSVILISFVIIVFLTGAYFLAGNKNSNIPIPKADPVIYEYRDWKTYQGETFSIQYPKDYEFYENKIVATEGIIEPAKNTIQLISPTLPNTNVNLSIIIAYKSSSLYLEEEKKSGSTCPELYEKKLKPILIGNHTYSQSGLVNCGSNEAAYFYIINGNNVFEAKVETTGDFEKDALPIVKQILGTIEFED